MSDCLILRRNVLLISNLAEKDSVYAKQSSPFISKFGGVISMVDEENVWNNKHNIIKHSFPTANLNDKSKDLFTDNDPACTIKGCGFKNKYVAQDTIRLSGQPGSQYKQYWTIRAMYERAKRHPAQTEGMRDAIKVFETWFENRKKIKKETSKEYVNDIENEKEQRARLVSSFANVHARSKCPSDEEFYRLARSDRKNGLKCLREGSKQDNLQKQFKFPITNFVSIFGGPGDHGYGRHVCNKAQDEGKSSFYCDCSPCFSGVHKIICDNPEILNLGVGFPFQQFHLNYFSNSQTAQFEKTVAKYSETGQTKLDDFFKPRLKRKTDGTLEEINCKSPKK